MLVAVCWPCEEAWKLGREVSGPAKARCEGGATKEIKSEWGRFEQHEEMRSQAGECCNRVIYTFLQRGKDRTECLCEGDHQLLQNETAV